MNLALFDFDGTITDRETMPDFMQAAVRPGRLARGKGGLLPLILGYRGKLVPGSVIRAVICRFGFWRVPVRELQMHGERFAVEYLPARLRPEAMARIEWHKSRGDTVVVVSGGLDVYLRHWCRDHGVELLSRPWRSAMAGSPGAIADGSAYAVRRPGWCASISRQNGSRACSPTVTRRKIRSCFALPMSRITSWKLADGRE